MPSHSLLFEDMIRAETEERVCRIWRQVNQEHINWPTNSDVKEIARSALGSDSSLINICIKIVNLDGVNSVEVIERSTGDGICVHKDWP